MEEKTYSEVGEKALLDVLRSEADNASRLLSVYKLIDFVFYSMGEESGLHFPTLFSRIAHFSTVLNLSPRITRGLHQFRLFAREFTEQADGVGQDEVTRWLGNGIVLGAAVLRALDPDSEALLRAEELGAYDLRLNERDGSGRKYKRTMRFLATEYVESEGFVRGMIEPDGESATLLLTESGRAEIYQEDVKYAAEAVGLPIMMSLVDVECSDQMELSPRMVVIEPDYLIDVTSVAECFQATNADSRIALLKSFMPREWSAPLLMGAIANFLLDEIIRKPDVKFSELVQSIFKIQPIAFTRMSDSQVQEVLNTAKSHYATLKQVVHGEFERMGIMREEALIEPTFYAPVFGLQGRLDLYHKGDGDSSTIIELKSGKPYMQNNYGLNSTHYIQTLLYHLLLRAVSDFREKPLAYILYSGQSTRPLRNAPVVGSLQREAIRLRNRIFLDQVRWLKTDASLKSFMRPDTFRSKTGFLGRDLERLSTGLNSLSDIETAYFQNMYSLVIGEQVDAKLGSRAVKQNNGLAGIWLLSDSQKEETFSLLKKLQVEKQEGSHDEIEKSILKLSKSGMTSDLANFREGDIAVVYPETGGSIPSALTNEIFKCTITRITSTHVYVRLRNDQVSKARFGTFDNWRIESDVLDSSFTSQYRALFRFAETSVDKRLQFLGIEPPKINNIEARESKSLVRRMIDARGYFLLWGPPGTGKTSIVLRDLTRHYLENTNERVLLLAYTNRAVDEICKSVESISDQAADSYVRIGSRVSTSPEYARKLLSLRLEEASNRKQVLDILKGARIIVSTVSSISGSLDILNILKIKVAVIDEASQILEPVLAGLLPLFEKYILIGDHCQLPAVVSQPESATVVEDEILHSIGLLNSRNSYFERMYKLAFRKGWRGVLGALVQQGRMHQDIASYVSNAYYDGQLETIDNTLTRDYTGGLSWFVAPESEVMQRLSTRRMLFFDMDGAQGEPWRKTNDREAMCVAFILKAFETVSLDRSIGVITPFRAQIANIKEQLEESGIDSAPYTIDTVERYQGSARDIVILSTVITQSVQINQIVSYSDEGLDRKLNVAITRAREQFILIGSRSALEASEGYRKLIDHCTVIFLEQWNEVSESID